MIEKKTTLVLGAGASAEYGYPLGNELKREVQAALLESPSDVHQALISAGFQETELEVCGTALRKSGDITIDGFLETRTDLRAVGKAAVAAVLIGHEYEDTLHDIDNNWYRFLWNRLAPRDLQAFDPQQLSVVTFNYDRSLETFLFGTFTNKYPIPASTAADLIGAMSIVHIHGRIGPLPWQDGGRPYVPTIETEAIRQAGNGIKVTSEGVFNGFVREEVVSAFRNSERVIFLGFGFDPANTGQLMLDLAPRASPIYFASCYRMAALQRDKVQELFRPAGIVFGDTVDTALPYLQRNDLL